MTELKPTRFTDDLLILIYGNNVDLNKIRSQKNTEAIWNDIKLFLANNDVTKLREVEQMNAMEMMDVLSSKIVTMKSQKTTDNTRNPIGYKNK